MRKANVKDECGGVYARFIRDRVAYEDVRYVNGFHHNFCDRVLIIYTGRSGDIGIL